MEAIRTVVEEDGRATFGADSPSELTRMFRLQMAYLLLWTVIERYAFLRSGSQMHIEKRIEAVGADPRFRGALTTATHGVPLTKTVFDRRVLPVALLDDAKHSLAYFREVRHHLVHRGKGMPDAERLRLSLAVLHRATAWFLEREGLA